MPNEQSHEKLVAILAEQLNLPEGLVDPVVKSAVIDPATLMAVLSSLGSSVPSLKSVGSGVADFAGRAFSGISDIASQTVQGATGAILPAMALSYFLPRQAGYLAGRFLPDVTDEDVREEHTRDLIAAYEGAARRLQHSNRQRRSRKQVQQAKGRRIL